MTDDRIEKLIWEELKKRNVCFYDMIGLPDHGVDPEAGNKTLSTTRKTRQNRFKGLLGCERMKELLCLGDYNPYDSYPPLRVSIQDLFRFWWNRFGPMFAAEIRKRRVQHRSYSNWRWHMDEVFVRINGETYYLWRAVDHEGEVLEAYAKKRRDRKAALKFLKRVMKRYGRPNWIVTDRLRSYRAAMVITV